MTVREMIQELSGWNPDLNVVIVSGMHEMVPDAAQYWEEQDGVLIIETELVK